MGIFRKRPLAAGCFCLIISLFLFAFFPQVNLWIPFIVCAAGLVGVFCLRQRCPYVSLYISLLLIGILCGTGRAALDRALCAPLTGAIGTEAEVTVSVTEVSYESSYTCEYIVKVEELEKRKITGNAVLRTTGELGLSEGDTLVAVCAVHALSFDTLYEGQEYRYAGNGNRVILIPKNVLDISPEERPGLVSRIKTLQRKSAARLQEKPGGEAGDLAAAILFGETSTLDDMTIRNFRRSGISHLLAISGLHLAVIAGAIERLLSWMRVGKRLRILLTSFFCVFYFFLTGCSYSTLRAMLLLFFVYLAFFLRKDADPLTSLLLAGALILLVSPYAVFSTSYQMTMLSAFGILTFGKLLSVAKRIFPKRSGVLGICTKICRAVFSSLAITTCATVALLPVQWLTFGEVSLIAPIANLCILPLSAPFLIGAMICFLLSFVPWLSFLVAAPVRGIAEIIFFLTGKFAAMDAMLSLRYSFCAYILIPVYALLLLLLLLDLKKCSMLTFSPVLLGALAFVICLGANGKLDRERIEISYYQSTNQEVLLFLGGRNGVFCDFSNGSATQWNAAYKVLQSMGGTEVKVLILTQYQDAVDETFASFSARVLVRELWVPEPNTDAERRILASLCKSAIQNGVTLTVYPREETLRVFYNASLTISEPLYESRSVKPALTLLLQKDSGSFLYISGTYPEYLSHCETDTVLPEADILLLGSAGPNPHEAIRLPYADRVILTSEIQLKLLEVEEARYYYYLPDKFYMVLD